LKGRVSSSSREFIVDDIFSTHTHTHKTQKQENIFYDMKLTAHSQTHTHTHFIGIFQRQVAAMAMKGWNGYAGNSQKYVSIIKPPPKGSEKWKKSDGNGKTCLCGFHREKA